MRSKVELFEQIRREYEFGVGTIVPEGMDRAQTTFPTVNSLGCAKVFTNAYSAPLKAGTQVQAKICASTVELWHEGWCVANA